MALEIALIVGAWLCLLLGILGCVIPGLPGAPLAFIGLLIGQFSERVDTPWWVLVILGVVTVLVSALDYIVPTLGAKEFGATKYGAWGSTLGLIVGLFFGVWGIILGPFIGAVLFELIGGKKIWESLKAGWGTFVGLMVGVIIKLMACGVMALVLLWQMF